MLYPLFYAQFCTLPSLMLFRPSLDVRTKRSVVNSSQKSGECQILSHSLSSFRTSASNKISFATKGFKKHKDIRLYQWWNKDVCSPLHGMGKHNSPPYTHVKADTYIRHHKWLLTISSVTVSVTWYTEEVIHLMFDLIMSWSSLHIKSCNYLQNYSFVMLHTVPHSNGANLEQISWFQLHHLNLMKASFKKSCFLSWLTFWWAIIYSSHSNCIYRHFFLFWDPYIFQLVFCQSS